MACWKKESFGLLVLALRLQKHLPGVAGVLNDFQGLADAPTGIDVLYAGELTAADLLSCPYNSLDCSAAVSSAVPVPRCDASC